MKVLSFLLLCLSLMSIWSALSTSPAFSPAARAVGLLGDWRVAAGPAMYDPAEYAFQRGYGYLVADALFSADTETVGEIAPSELADQRAQQAIEAFETSVSLAPGHAYAWAELAWAYARMARDDDALSALRTSWSLAPHNRQLADTRINLAGLLSDPETAIVTLSGQDFAALSADAHTLARTDRQTLSIYAEDLPHLAAALAQQDKT